MTGIAFASPPPRTAERDGACFRHRRVGRGAAGYRCPTTSRNERPLLPHIDLLEFDQICGGFGTVPKLIDTDGQARPRLRWRQVAPPFAWRFFPLSARPR